MHSDAVSAGTSPAAIIRPVSAATVPHECLYRTARSFYTALVIETKPPRKRLPPLPYWVAACLLFTAGWHATSAQETQQKPAAEPSARNAGKSDKSEKPAHPAQIELLETKVRFEANGDSRKEVHALVKINSELGVRQFAQLNFDFNRSFESVEIPMVHITHANGGTADILPSAITDHPNPAVVNFPPYQDVRVKSVRILGLHPGDTLEYRVIRTVSHHPLAPDFWLDHTFERSGIVSHEVFELDLPASRTVQMRIPQDITAPNKEEVGSGESARLEYRWNLAAATSTPSDTNAKNAESHLLISTFASWEELANRLQPMFETSEDTVRGLYPKATELIHGEKNADEWINSFYDFVSQKIKTIDLPLGATGYQMRKPSDILSSGYATPEDKFVLFAAIENNYCGPARAGLVISNSTNPERELPLPTAFDHLLTMSGYPSVNYWMDLASEVAPYRMILPQFRRKPTLLVGRAVTDHWPIVLGELPFDASQTVKVSASLPLDGKLSAKVRYTMRGDNELVLREAFHRTPKENWKEVAQLLSITDGFRGQVTSVNASDPYATKEPFTVEYELDQPKFVDWLKKPVRIPALLPQLGLPDPAAKPASGSATAPIDLGTPLEVETKMTLQLPPGTSASAPAGTSVERDYATYSSQYAVNGSTLTATRRIKFILREVPAPRAADYNAFLRAVQNDESQDFTLERTENAVPKTNSAAPNNTTPPKTPPPRP